MREVDDASWRRPSIRDGVAMGERGDADRDQSNGAFRRPTERELSLLSMLVGHDFAGAEELARQLVDTLVEPLDQNGSLRLIPGEGMPAAVTRRIPVEASYPDLDGVVVHVLLHVVNGRLAELEVFRDDSGTVLLTWTGTTAWDVDHA